MDTEKPVDYSSLTIDTSIMEESENIFVLVLAAMFSKVQKFSNEKIRKLMNMITGFYIKNLKRYMKIIHLLILKKI